MVMFKDFNSPLKGMVRIEQVEQKNWPKLILPKYKLPICQFKWKERII